MVRLVIVPWLAAGIRLGTAWANDLNNTSTMRCDISTLPPATDAGGFAFTTVPRGAITSMGSINPALAGTSPPIRQRNTYDTAETVIASTALIAPATCGALPVKSTDARSPLIDTRTLIATGRSSTPSSSNASSASYAPSGID